MAKRVMTWSMDNGVLGCSHTDGNATSYDLGAVFPEILDYTDVQLKVIAYGVKQKLADSCARPSDQTLTYGERVAVMAGLYDQLVAGKWSDRKGSDRISVKAIKDKVATMELTKSQREVLSQLGLI